jgi:hypothetical protein
MKTTSLILVAIAALGWTAYSQNLIMKSPQGKRIAGYSANAIDPSKAKLSLVYEYQWVADGKTNGFNCLQKVAGVDYKEKLTVTGSDTNMDSSYKIKGKAVTVNFKSITQDTDKSGDTVDILTISSEDGKEFKFQVGPITQFYFTIEDKGEFGRYLKSLGPQDEN